MPSFVADAHVFQSESTAVPRVLVSTDEPLIADSCSEPSGPIMDGGLDLYTRSGSRYTEKVRIRCRYTCSRGQLGSARKTSGPCTCDAQPGGISPNVGLNEGRSVSAAEKVLRGGLGATSEAEELAREFPSPDFADLIFGLVGARRAPPSRKSPGCSDSEFPLGAMGGKSSVGPIRREAEDPAPSSIRNSPFGGRFHQTRA